MGEISTFGRRSRLATALGWLWAGDPDEGTAGLVRGSPVTWLLGALIVAVWLASEVAPGHSAVRRALGSSGLDVAKGQWWRLFTPGLLNTADFSGRIHTSALGHLLFNLLPLVLVGPRVERVLGRARLVGLWIAAELLGRAWLAVLFPRSLGLGGGSSIFTTALQGAALLDAGLHRRRTTAERWYLAVFGLAAMLEVGNAAFYLSSGNNNAHAAGLVAGMAVVVGAAFSRRWGPSLALGLVATVAFGLAGYHTFDLRRVTARLQATIAVGRTPLYVAAGAGAVWVSNYRDSTVSRIDPSSNRVVATIPLGGRLALGIAVGDGAVWVVDSPRSIVRVDPTSNRVVARVAVPAHASDIAYSCGSVWVSSVGSNLIIRIDPVLDQMIASVPVEPRPFELDADSSSVWVASLDRATLTRLDPATNRVLSKLHIDGRAQDVAIGAHSLWVAGRATLHGSADGGSLTPSPSGGTNAYLLATDGDQAWGTHFDNTVLHFAANGRVVERLRLGLTTRSSGIAVAAGSIWVTDLRGGRVLRLRK